MGFFKNNQEKMMNLSADSMDVVDYEKINMQSVQKIVTHPVQVSSKFKFSERFFYIKTHQNESEALETAEKSARNYLFENCFQKS